MGDVVISRNGVAGRITLDRPKALHALSEPMVDMIVQALDAWRGDPAVTRIIIDASGERAFCAGGDVRSLCLAAQDRANRANAIRDAERYFRKEYRMNAALADFPKPVISFMQGIIMGGGVGLGCHVSHRVIAPDAVLAMPETRIGLVPDVGGTHLLARMPGALGLYFALTGARMTGIQAVAGGFADHAIAPDMWDRWKQALCDGAEPQDLAGDALTADGALDDLQARIDPVFDRPTLFDIRDAVAGGAFAQAFDGLSPISLHATYGLIAQAQARPGIRPALEREFAFTSRALDLSDFAEGVRAALIDKDGTPDWHYPTIDAVPQDLLMALAVPVQPKLFQDVEKPA